MKRFGLIFIFLLFVMSLTIGLNFLNTKKSFQNNTALNPQVTRDLEDARNLLAISKPRETLMLVEEYQNEIQKETPLGKVWLDLFIQAAVQQNNIPQLIQLYEFSPTAFDSYEEASQKIADAYLDLEKSHDFEELRNRWKGRESLTTKWALLDADKHVLDGQTKRAIILLTTKHFSGKDETERLLKLALLNAADAPDDSWEYLELAKKQNPNDADLFIYRGELQEKFGNLEKAQQEFTQASRIEPDNLIIQDQVADFFVRSGDPQRALDIWKNHLNEPSLDTVWLKAIFWNKVLSPIDINWKNHQIPQGYLTPLIKYLVNLGTDEFWNEEKFSTLLDKDSYLHTRQELYWLRLLDQLQENNFTETALLLKYNPFETRSWNPDFEQALKYLISYQNDEVFDDNNAFKRNHPLFNSLEELSMTHNIPEGFKSFTQDKEILSAIALASGWTEAGLKLHKEKQIPENYPTYVTLEIIQALNKNRSDFETMNFAMMQNETPEITFILGQLLIEGGNMNEGVDKLENLAQQTTNIGLNAALLLTRYYYDQSHYDKAKKVVENNPRLENDVAGKEYLARIAHTHDDFKQAETLYSSIVTQSTEAKSYLAKRAYDSKDWKKAKELTETLLIEYPNNITLKQNLEKIKRKQNS